jgi:hypothetical protein
MGQSLHDKLEYAQSLLSHKIPSGEVAEVLERALDLLIVKLEKARFAATDHPRPQREPARGRHIPAEVRRRVRQRDQDRCTFVSATGHRCEARKYLEYDHIEPVARGGNSTVENLRLRCRTHNQYEAELAFGAGFMHEIRERARRAARRGDVAEAARSDAQSGAAPRSTTPRGRLTPCGLSAMRAAPAPS